MSRAVNAGGRFVTYTVVMCSHANAPVIPAPPRAGARSRPDEFRTPRLAALLAVALGAMGCGASVSTDGAAQADETTAVQPLGPTPEGHPARYAIVLAHGFNASPTNGWSFFRVPEALRGDGHVVHVAAVPPFASVEVRATALAQHVDAAMAECAAIAGCDGAKVNIIAHSMGGLDARYLVSSLGYGDRVASLTTISTPHRGSAIADVALKFTSGDAAGALDALARAYGATFTSEDLASQTDLRAALSSLAEANAAAFQQANPDDARVEYQSWAGVSNVLGVANPQDDAACENQFLTFEGRRHVMSASLALNAAFVAHGTEMRPNDGMATVESAKWGKFRGCVPADHLAEVGQSGLVGMNPRTGFDHLRFYRNIAFELADRGM